MHAFLRKIKTLPIIVLAAFSFAFVGAVQPALAACDPANEQKVSIGLPGAVERGGEWCIPLNKGNRDIFQNPILIYLKGVVQFLAVGIGLAVVGGIIFGGVTYLTARANAGQVEKAIEIIRSAIIGLLLYIFMFAIINFLIPGGILT